MAIPALLIIMLLFFPYLRVLSISSRTDNSNKLYSRLALKGFDISYTHSVNRGRIVDHYLCLKNGMLDLDTTKFVSYGAGVMEPGDIVGTEFSITEDGFLIKGINRHIKELNMIVGLITDHRIIVDGKELCLKDEFGVQNCVTLKVKHTALITYFLQKGTKLDGANL